MFAGLFCFLRCNEGYCKPTPIGELNLVELMDTRVLKRLVVQRNSLATFLTSFILVLENKKAVVRRLFCFTCSAPCKTADCVLTAVRAVLPNCLGGLCDSWCR